MIGDCGSVYDKDTGKYKRVSCNDHGYVYGKFQTNDDTIKSIAVHRLVAHEFVDGYCEETGRTHVDHYNFKKDDNDADNLRWLTPSENSQHRFDNPDYINPKPPTFYGTDHPFCKHDTDIIERICELLAQGYSVIDTFYTFGYKAQSENKAFYSLIYDIKRKRSWTIISDKYF